MARLRCQTMPSNTIDDMVTPEMQRGIRIIDERDRLVDYLKTTKGQVLVSEAARACGMRFNRPSAVATAFPMTLVTRNNNVGKNHAYYIDLHPHLRQYHR